VWGSSASPAHDALLLPSQPPDLPVHHVLGNHCLDLPKAAVLARLRAPAAGRYTVPLAPGWRLVGLDTTEMSGHSQEGPESAAAKEAAAFLAARPLSDDHPQMSPWNGGVGAGQLAWLQDELVAAAAAGDRVVVAGHHQAGPGAAARRSHAAWNHDAIYAALENSPARLYLAGHDHEGGYAAAGGVHWLTLEAICEAPPGSNAYAVLHFYGDRVVVEGVGAAVSRELAL